MRRLYIILVLCLLPLIMAPAPGNIRVVSTAPSGSCTQSNEIRILTGTTGGVYTCTGGAWSLQFTLPSKLDLVPDNVAVDEQCLTYEASLLEFEWQDCGSGGGGISRVEEDDTTIASSVTALDFGTHFDISESPTGEVNVSLDLVESQVNLTTEVTGALPIVNGGTGQVTASAARASLGAAGSGANSDITSFTGVFTAPLSTSRGGTDITSAADDQTIVSNGVTFEAKTIPNCPAGNQLLYTQATNLFSCEADGASGTGTYTTVQDEGVNVGAVGSGTTINFVGGAIAATGSGAVKTVTVNGSPDSASLVGTGRSLTGGAGIATIGDLTSDRSIATASDEADFLAVSALTCGAGTKGKAAISTTLFNYCDNSGTPTLRQAALGDTSGNALTGDTASAFFSAGTLEVARGGTGAGSIGVDTQCLFNDGGNVGADAGCTYNKTLNEIVVDSVNTQGGCTAAGNDCYDELRCDAAETSVAAPSAAFGRVFCHGAAGSEKWSVLVATTGLSSVLTETNNTNGGHVMWCDADNASTNTGTECCGLQNMDCAGAATLTGTEMATCDTGATGSASGWFIALCR